MIHGPEALFRTIASNCLMFSGANMAMSSLTTGLKAPLASPMAPCLFAVGDAVALVRVLVHQVTAACSRSARCGASWARRGLYLLAALRICSAWCGWTWARAGADSPHPKRPSQAVRACRFSSRKLLCSNRIG